MILVVSFLFFHFLSDCNPLRVRSYYLQHVCTEPKISNSEYNWWLWVAFVFKLTFSSRCLERFFSFSQMEISANHHHASSHLPAVYLPLLRINLALECFTNSLEDFHKYQLHLNNGLINTALWFKMSCMKNRWSLHVLHSCYSDAKYVTEKNHMLFARVSKEFDNDNYGENQCRIVEESTITAMFSVSQTRKQRYCTLHWSWITQKSIHINLHLDSNIKS